jgi:hypothetical protein
MGALPLEMWLHIFSFIEKEYAYDDEFSSEEECPATEFDSTLAINKEYEGWYYPVHMLYQTSKAFSWLREYEVIYVDSGEFHCVVYISDINGGALDLIDTNGRNLMGYRIGDKRCEHGTDSAYHYRYVDDKKYYDNKNCERWWRDCKECDNCIQLDAIESQIFTVDPVIKRMVRGGETQEVVIREKSMRLRNLDLKYDASGLELCS